MHFACINATILGDDGLLEGQALVVKDGNIAQIVPQEALAHELNTIDLKGLRLVPGFIDLQVNGGNDVLFNDAPTIESVRKSPRPIGSSERLRFFLP